MPCSSFHIKSVHFSKPTVHRVILRVFTFQSPLFMDRHGCYVSAARMSGTQRLSLPALWWSSSTTRPGQCCCGQYTASWTTRRHTLWTPSSSSTTSPLWVSHGHGTIPHNTAQYNTIRHHTLWTPSSWTTSALWVSHGHGTIQHSTIQSKKHNTVHYNMIQCNAMQ